MKNYNIFALLCVIFTLTCIACGETQTAAETPEATPESTETAAATEILIFSKTNGYRHESIETGQETLRNIADKKGWKTTVTEDSTVFNSENLSKFAAVVFLSTTGDVLGAAEEAAFEKYITEGGNFMGIHAAADTEYDWKFYNELVGAYFKDHPNDPNIRNAVVRCTDKTHASTKHLPDEWQRDDEWYNYKSIQPNLKVLLTLDESTYEGGNNGDFHPIAWYHNQGKGRAFYTGGGHTKEAFAEPLFIRHLAGGLTYVVEGEQ